MEEGFSARDELIQSHILELLSKDPNGVELDVLGDTVIENLKPYLKIEPEEIGPCLMKLNEDNLIYGLTRIDSEGAKMVIRCERFIPSKFAPIRCMIVGHDVPSDLAFETQLALFRGGFCRRCGKLIQGEFLGNVWTEEVEGEICTELKGYDVSAATKLGLKVMAGL